MLPKIVFIDNGINVEYIQKLLTKEQTIQGKFVVSAGKVVPTVNQESDTLSHVTFCCQKFLEYTSSPCELYFIDIWEAKHSKNANVNSLLIALSWCLEQDMKLINLSLGTPSISDGMQLFEIINQLAKKKTIIVSANSNHHKLTFPAVFHQVIGVKALESKNGETGLIYHEDSLDKIEISCYLEDSFIDYKDQTYALGCDNSLATPMITAQICTFLSEVNESDSLTDIKMKLKERSLSQVYHQLPKTYDQYLKAESKVPIIGILNNNKRTHDKNYGISSLAQRLFASFKADGYEGICLSEWDETDLSKTTLNIRELSSYTPIEKIRFYTHYCLIDYILVEISETFLLEELRSNEIDIIIYSDTDADDLEKTESSRWIVFSETDNFESFFEQLYHELSEE